MELLFILTAFLASIAAFILCAVDRHRALYNNSPLPGSALIPLAIFGPFGMLCGMALLGNRPKNYVVVLSIVMLIVWIATAFLLRF